MLLCVIKNLHHVIGFGYGNHEDASFILNELVALNPGNNTVDMLSMMIGVQVHTTI